MMGRSSGILGVPLLWSLEILCLQEQGGIGTQILALGTLRVPLSSAFPTFELWVSGLPGPFLFLPHVLEGLPEEE